MSSCFGRRKKDSQGEREPLLPQYDQDTDLQRKLHQKLHSYQMWRAITLGYMPSTEQVIINLRTFLSSDVLDADNPDLSPSGHRLVKNTRRWIQQVMDLLQHKNDQDYVQDLIWFLSKSRIDMDTEDIMKRTRKVKAKADTAAAYQSLKTVGSLLLTNSDFRIFLGDLNTIGREVFKDSAFALSDVAEQAGKAIEPSSEDQQAVAKPGADAARPAPDASELGGEIADAGKVITDGAVQVAQTATESATDKLSGDEGKTVLNRLKQAVLNLRQRPDYAESVSILSLLLKRYALVYSRMAQDLSDMARDDVQENEATDRAMRNLWTLVRKFGDPAEWDKCETMLQKIMSHKESNPQFEQMIQDLGDSLQQLLMDPEFLDHASDKFGELKAKMRSSGSEGDISHDVQQLIGQIETTWQSVLHDEDVQQLITTTVRIFQILSPPNQATNSELVQDSIDVFVPLLISAIQYVPIPRIEISTPEADILLENLILEPGQTVNKSSFLPYRLKIETYNDVEIRKARVRTTAKATSLMTIKIDGLSARADEVGFWLRAHAGLLRLADEGIASFALDEKGIDIHLDVEIGREQLEQVLTLKAVRVHIHKLNYQLRKSRFSWIGWLLKPLVRPILRKTMEKQLASAIADFFHAANRELLFARERLRATRISDPNDLLTFVKAVAARLTPPDDPDMYMRLGIAQPGEGVFKNVYAPGSIVKVWNEEASRARERIEDYEAAGWRNEIFDTHVVA